MSEIDTFHFESPYAERLARAVGTVSAWLRHLIDPDQVVELRALSYPKEQEGKGPTSTLAGTFLGNELSQMAEEALLLSGRCQGVYYTLHPLKHSHHQGRVQRMRKARTGETASDDDVIERRRFFVDVDRFKLPENGNDPATDEERARAAQLAEQVQTYLSEQGFPKPVKVDSGNGIQLIYRLAQPLTVSKPLPPDDVFRSALRHLAHRFDGPNGTVDVKVFNPSRIARLPGPLNCKGDSTPERPHRRARLLDEGDGGTVSTDCLLELARKAPPEAHYSRPSLITTSSTKGDVLSRARAYLTTIPHAVSGQRGHDRTFYAAGRLVRGFALAHDAAFGLLAEWNQRCDPPWSEHDLRRKLAEADRQPGPRGFLLAAELPPAGAHARKDGSAAAAFRNYVWDEVPDGETMRKVRRGRLPLDLVQELFAYTGGWPRKVGGMLFGPGPTEKVEWLKSTAELFAWVAWQYGMAGGKGVDWASGPDCVPQQQFYAVCLQHAEEYDQVELYPHEPPLPKTYYYHPEPAGGDGQAVAGFLRHFCPSTSADEDLILAFLLTLFWGGPPGQRPVFVFQAPQHAAQAGRGAGKSTIPGFAAMLVGGHLSVGMDEDEGEIHRRLLGPSGRVKRLALIDNVKTLRFSSRAVEALLTCREISGRQMFVGEGSRPNFITWCMTFNDPSLSKDMAQRAVVIEVTTPSYDPAWVRGLEEYVEKNRWALVGDLLAVLRQRSRLPDDFTFTRWATWEGEVLACVPDPRAAQAVILDRRKLVDDDEDLYAEATEVIHNVIKRKFGEALDPEKMYVHIPANVVSDSIVKRLNSKYASDSRIAMRWFLTLKVPNTRKNDVVKPYRGILWKGEKCEERAPREWGEVV